MKVVVYILALVLGYLLLTLGLDTVDKKITIVEKEIGSTNPNEVVLPVEQNQPVPAIDTIPSWEDSFNPPSRFFRDNGQVVDRCGHPEALLQCEFILRQLQLLVKEEDPIISYEK